MDAKSGVSFAELVDLAALQKLLDDFSRATGLAVSVLAPSGEILAQSGWSDLCLHFHRRSPLAAARCVKSDRLLARAAARRRDQVINVCANGLVLAATPVFVAGRHLATLFLSQVFFAPPDEARFRAQARELGLEEEPYLAAVRRIPVVPEARFRQMARFFTHMATFISTLAQQYWEQKQLHEQMKRQRAHLEAIFQGSGDAMRIIDTGFRVQEQNRRMAAMAGVPEGQSVGQYCFRSFHHPYCGTEKCILRRILFGEATVEEEVAMVRPDGQTVFVELIATPLRDEKGQIVGVIESFRDISVRKHVEEQLRFLSLHDPLTGLYNRTYFEEEMRRLDMARHRPISIIVADVDGLKIINDTLGHDRGDAYLCTAAEIMQGAFRAGDCVARVGGDEFAVLLPQTDRAAAEAALQRIRNTVENYNAAHPLLPLSLSIGCATTGDASPSLVHVYKEADDAMYRAKIRRRTSVRHALLQAFTAALDERDFIAEGHAARLKDLAVRLGQAVGLPETGLDNLRLLARFHDIGKVGIPDRILFKPAPLTPEERREMERHAEIGYRIALASPILTPIAELILKHHEWYNGEGYPLKLKGKEIPLECRILAIVDAYDAMTSERPYRKPLPAAEAVRELQRCAGSQFDPELVPVFIALLGHPPGEPGGGVPDEAGGVAAGGVADSCGFAGAGTVGSEGGSGSCPSSSGGTVPSGGTISIVNGGVSGCGAVSVSGVVISGCVSGRIGATG